MRSLQIVDRAPAIEGALDFRQSAERPQSKYFRFQAADSLRVEGCVGALCGGETWTRAGR
jgi:hypothetical protein